MTVQALALELKLGHRTGVAIISNNIGDALRLMRHRDEALASLGRALALFQETGDRYGEGITELTLGETYRDMSRPDDAIINYLRALAAHDDAGSDDVERANVLRNLAETYSSLGRTAEARDAWRAALPILDRLGDPGTSEIRARLDALADSRRASRARRVQPHARWCPDDRWRSASRLRPALPGTHMDKLRGDPARSRIGREAALVAG